MSAADWVIVACAACYLLAFVFFVRGPLCAAVTIWAIFGGRWVPLRVRWALCVAVWWLRFPSRAEREATWEALTAEWDAIAAEHRLKAPATEPR